MDVFPAFALPTIRTRNWIFGFGRRRGCRVYIGATSRSKKIDSIDSSHDRQSIFLLRTLPVLCLAKFSRLMSNRCVLFPLLLYIIVSPQSIPTGVQNIWAIHNLPILFPRCDIVRRVALSTLTHPAFLLEHQLEDPIRESTKYPFLTTLPSSRSVRKQLPTI